MFAPGDLTRQSAGLALRQRRITGPQAMTIKGIKPTAEVCNSTGDGCKIRSPEHVVLPQEVVYLTRLIEIASV